MLLYGNLRKINWVDTLNLEKKRQEAAGRNPCHDVTLVPLHQLDIACKNLVSV